MAPLSKTLKAAPTKKMLRKGVTPTPPFSKEVQRVLDRLPSKAPPVRLPFTDVGEDYKGAACHLNAKHRVATAGGQRVHGWVVWQFLNAAQAEFHSVWRDTTGALTDITPHRNAQAEILFVEDPSLAIGSDPSTRLPLLYSDITSDPGPDFYKAGPTKTTFSRYTFQFAPGGTLAEELNRLRMFDFV